MLGFPSAVTLFPASDFSDEHEGPHLTEAFHEGHHHVHNTYTQNIQTHVSDLARGTYSSVHVLDGACLVPPGMMLAVRGRLCRDLPIVLNRRRGAAMTWGPPNLRGRWTEAGRLKPAKTQEIAYRKAQLPTTLFRGSAIRADLLRPQVKTPFAFSTRMQTSILQIKILQVELPGGLPGFEGFHPFKTRSLSSRTHKHARPQLADTRQLYIYIYIYIYITPN